MAEYITISAITIALLICLGYRYNKRSKRNERKPKHPAR